jgi:DNA mismatch repair protein MutS2
MPGFFIDHHTLEELQFSIILEQLKGYTFSKEGSSTFEDPSFITDREQLDYVRDMVAEILDVFSLNPSVTVATAPAIDQALVQAEKAGSTLDGEQLFDIGFYLDTASRLPKQFLIPDREQPLLRTLLSSVPDLSGLRSVLKEYLVTPGLVREDHPRIRRLTEAVRKEKEERARLIGRLISDSGPSLQASQAAVRDGRLVLPVKSHDKKELPGIMHASSHSGNTLFIEPFELVEKNNAVSIAEQQVAIEIEKIYRELTLEVSEALPIIGELQDIAGRFDRFYALARYALEHHCTRVETSTGGIVLKKARHPLLKEKAVPIDIDIDDQTRIIVMSGPNAGGKTVTLKTVGFFVLMNQLGMYLPASDGVQLPIFDSIWTDIGDEQSIELELSTFSGHLKRISTILQHSGPGALVILDELGTGTDPIEGAALAQAILEHCRSHTALTLVTSHHSVLKQYAYAREQVTNASMEFDEISHTPTFSVVFGHPGQSRAIETANRLDFPSGIISEAEKLLGDSMLDVSKMMQHLQQKEQELAGQEEVLKAREHELTERSRALDLEKLKVRQESVLHKSRDISSLQRFIKESRSLLEQTVRSLREQGELSKEQIRAAHEVIEGFQEREKIEQEKISKERDEISGRQKPEAAFKIEAGDAVVVKSNRRQARVVRQEKKDTYLVELDNGMRVTLPKSELGYARQESPDKKVHVVMDQYDQRPVSTIDIRGMTLSEALIILERQIDSALLSGLSNFSVIHGKGEGILQTGVREYLSHHKDIQSFTFARPEDGGYGKTLVEL